MSKVTSPFSAVVCAALVAAATMVGWPSAAFAWPDRTVTIVVPYAAGGNTDVMARMVAQELGKTFGQSFVVENVLGAGGTLAGQKVVSSAPDGHTLFFASTAQLSIAPFMQKTSYNPVADFIPLAVFGQSFSVLGVHHSVPAKDLREF